MTGQCPRCGLDSNDLQMIVPDPLLYPRRVVPLCAACRGALGRTAYSATTEEGVS